MIVTIASLFLVHDSGGPFIVTTGAIAYGIRRLVRGPTRVDQPLTQSTRIR